VRAARIPSGNQRFFPGVITGPRAGLPAPKRDKRSKEVRRALSRMRQVVLDLGGESELSQVQIDLLERYAWACHWLEKIEDIVIRGGKVPPDQWYALVNVQTRIAQLLGLERKARRLPTISEYMAARASPPAPTKAAAAVSSAPQTPAAPAAPGVEAELLEGDSR
jgi:hypothetical protein